MFSLGAWCFNLRDCQLDYDVLNVIMILNRSKLSSQDNPDSRRKRIVACRMRNPGIFFYCGIWNPGFWNLESSSRNLESHYRLEFRIHFSLTTNPKSSTCNLEYQQSGTQNPRLSWIILHGVKIC